MKDLNWAEFTGYYDDKILINKQYVCQVVKCSNKTLKTEIIFNGGHSVLVKEDYDEVKEKLTSMNFEDYFESLGGIK